MFKSLAIVFALAAMGDSLVDIFELPVPGAALGMIMLAGFFSWRRGPGTSMAGLFDGMAPHLPLFFVPAAVGIVASAELLSQAWVHIATAIALGTATTIGVTGLIAQRLLRSPKVSQST